MNEESPIGIVRLERTSRRLRLWCTLLTVGALGACLLGFRHPSEKVVEAESFVVVGPDGLVRARLGGNAPMASRGLVLYGRNGGIAAFLTAEKDGSVAFRMASDRPSPASFAVVVDGEKCGSSMMGPDRTIEARVDPASSSISFNGPSAPLKAGEAPDLVLEKLHPVRQPPHLTLEVKGEKPSVSGLDTEGAVLFHQP